MDESIKFFVGLDTHKDSIAVAVCEAGREPSRFVGTLGPDVQGVLKTLRKYGPAQQVSVVYEAGPTGYGLHRELSRRGYQASDASGAHVYRGCCQPQRVDADHRSHSRSQAPQSSASSLGHITVTKDVPRRNSMRISAVAATATDSLATSTGSVLKVTGTNACG